MIGFRPCGACAELVPADEGCRHWKPDRPAKVNKSGRRNLDAMAARGRARRARLKAEVEAAREAGRLAVKDFARWAGEA